SRARLPGTSERDILERISTSVMYARSRGLSVRYTVEDASRTDIERLLRAYRAAIEGGANRICFADTVGVLEPGQVVEFVRILKREFGRTELELHLHDDRGLAMANTLAGIDAGADWISASVNGLGERAGITDLCLLLANLHYRDRTRPLLGGELLRDLS